MSDWYSRANCRGVDPELFFPERGVDEIVTRRAALAVCAGCEVREQCLSAAIDQQERWGIWGGKTTPERKFVWRPNRSKSA